MVEIKLLSEQNRPLENGEEEKTETQIIRNMFVIRVI